GHRGRALALRLAPDDLRCLAEEERAVGLRGKPFFQGAGQTGRDRRRAGGPPALDALLLADGQDAGGEVEVGRQYAQPFAPPGPRERRRGRHRVDPRQAGVRPDVFEEGQGLLAGEIQRLPEGVLALVGWVLAFDDGLDLTEGAERLLFVLFRE